MPDINNREKWGERVKVVYESLYSPLKFPVNLKLLQKKLKTINFFFSFKQKKSRKTISKAHLLYLGLDKRK